MKRLLTYLFLLVFAGAFAQQEPMFTHYMENTLSVNPAYAGSRDALTFTLLHRSQWIGFQGAPVTQTFTLHTPVSSDKLGLGLAFVNDNIGAASNGSLYFDFAYRIKLKSAHLAFGVSAGLNRYILDFSDGYIPDANDPQALNYQSEFMPNFGAGVYYYSQKFYVGMSVPRILTVNLLNSSIESNLLTQARHYYLIGGGIFDLGKNLKFFPTTLVKYTYSAVPELDATASFVFKDLVRAGAMVRSTGTMGVLLGLFLPRGFSVGYSFDWSTNNATGVYNAGSHELMLRYDWRFAKRNGAVVSPRMF